MTAADRIRRWIPIQRPADRAELDALVQRCERYEQIEQAVRDLLDTWEMSADSLGAEWIGFEKRIIALHEALRLPVHIVEIENGV